MSHEFYNHSTRAKSPRSIVHETVVIVHETVVIVHETVVIAPETIVIAHETFKVAEIVQDP